MCLQFYDLHSAVSAELKPRRFAALKFALRTLSVPAFESLSSEIAGAAKHSRFRRNAIFRNTNEPQGHYRRERSYPP